MRYLNDFENFKIFEAIQETTEEIQRQAERNDLDLEDPNVQKIIADELAKKIEQSGEKLDLNLDFEKLVDKVQSQNESKIFEKEELTEKVGEDEIKKTVQETKKIQALFTPEIVKEMIKKIKEEPEEVKPQEVKIETTKWQKIVLKASEWLEKTYKWTTNTMIWKGVVKVLSFISSIFSSISRLVRSIISWVSRNIFGASHVTTSRVANYSAIFTRIITILIGVVLFAFPALVLGTATISFVSILGALTAKFFTSLTSLFSGIVFLMQLIFGKIRTSTTTYSFDEEAGLKGDQTLVFGFLDKLEKVLGKGIKMSQFVRDYLKGFEDRMVRRCSTGNFVRFKGGKTITEMNNERAKRMATELTKIHEIWIHPAGALIRNLSENLRKIGLDENKLEKAKLLIRDLYKSISEKKEKTSTISRFKSQLNNLLNPKQKENLKSIENEVNNYIVDIEKKALKSGKFQPIPWQIIQGKITKSYFLENGRLLHFFDKIIERIKNDGIEKIKELGSTGYFIEITGFPEGIPLVNELVWNSLGLSPQQEITNETIKEWELWCSKRWYRPLDMTIKDILQLYASPEIKTDLEKIRLDTQVFIPASKYKNEKKIDTEEEYRDLRDKWGIDEIEKFN